MEKCPTCGQRLQPKPPTMLGADDLLRYLQASPEKYAYEGRDKNWYVTKSIGIQTSRGAVDALAARGLIRRKYSDMDGAWWLGRTVDIPATNAARKYGQKTIIYL